MHFFFAAIGLLLIFVVLWDAFETVILPRTITRSLRLTRVFYRVLWRAWSSLVKRVRVGERRTMLLAIFGPFSLLLLFCLWSSLLIFGFALVQFGLHLPTASPSAALNAQAVASFGDYLYESGVTFYTLGYGDVIPRSALGRTIAVLESGTGFGLLAIIVSYLPVIYQAFSRRETTPLLLDARAGSPPTAGALIQRHAQSQMMEAMLPLLEKFEIWSADILESFISYPVLAYYRAQHERLAWLSALTTILDTTALIQASLPDNSPASKALRWQAQLTFALARHVLVDISYLLHVSPTVLVPDRLSQESWRQLCLAASQNEVSLLDDADAWHQLQKFRREYEPFVFGLASFLLLAVPAWSTQSPTRDSWQITAWDAAEQATHF